MDGSMKNLLSENQETKIQMVFLMHCQIYNPKKKKKKQQQQHLQRNQKNGGILFVWNIR